MRNGSFVFLSAFLGLATLCATACSDDGTLSDNSSSGGNTSSTSSSSGGSSSGDVNNLPQDTVEGDITANRKLTKDKVWLLKGLVSVKAGATLEIEAGTTIKGDNASKAILLVEPGGKIQAVGTADEPIVFTSQANGADKKPGQWGGILLLGKAPINVKDANNNPIQASIEGILKTGQSGTLYGGNDPEDSSGAMQYVRIEYSGIVIATDNEVNGLTLAGVGRGTKLDHIQVRQTLDDCFEFFGGTVDAKYLACQSNQDDGFDFDLGYTGRLQFLVLQQDPNHEGDDNGFESDNDEKGTGATPLTAPQVYNATLVGKNSVKAGSQFGLLLRRNSRGTYKNLVVTGFQAGFDLRDNIGNPGELSIGSSLMWNAVGVGAGFSVADNIAFVEDKSTVPNGEDEKKYKARPDFIDDATDEIVWFKGDATNKFSLDPKLPAPFDLANPGFGPTTSLTDGASTPPSDGFFDTSATYMGAFKDANDKWAQTGKWAVWAAQ